MRKTNFSKSSLSACNARPVHTDGPTTEVLAEDMPQPSGHDGCGRSCALAADDRVIRLRYQFIDQRRWRLATLKVGFHGS